jgi:hypothetical protein
MTKPLEKRRRSDRERLKRWRKKKLAEGNKQIQLMLIPEAQKALAHEKQRTGEPYVQIINRAIVHIKQSRPSAAGTTNERTVQQQKIVQKIRKLWQDGYTYAAIADILNSEDSAALKNLQKWRAMTVLEMDRKG